MKKLFLIFLMVTSSISVSMLLIFGYCIATAPAYNFSTTFLSNIYGEGWFEAIACPISAVTTTILILITILKLDWFKKKNKNKEVKQWTGVIDI